MSEESKYVHVQFIQLLYRAGLPLLRLWGTDTINGVVRCRCQRYPWNYGKDCSPGKHLYFSLKRSVIKSEEDLMAWIEDGGNVGISLGFTKPGAPPSPVRLVVFDDDDGTARAWLAAHGVTSPWTVRGKRGSHVYCIIADGVPDLLTKCDYFKPLGPKMDIKVSGLVVLPLDNGKTLEVDGQEVTLENIAFLDRFSSLITIKSWLPVVDPRAVFPLLKERLTEPETDKTESVIGAISCISDSKVLHGKNKKTVKAKLVSRQFSLAMPDNSTFNSNYKNILYSERKRLCKSHCSRILPSVRTKQPWKKLVKIVNDCIHNYGMSDQTTWELIRDYYNPRCQYEDGSHYPWKRNDVGQAIKWAHAEGAYSTMTQLDGLANPEKNKQRLKKQGQASNARRNKKTAARRAEVLNALLIALAGLGYMRQVASDDALVPSETLYSGSIIFTDLYNQLKNFLSERNDSMPSKKMLGVLLTSLNLETYAGYVRSKRHRT